PYLNKAQITSGSLAYAVGAGAAVVSTPYWHAEELLAENRGQLFDFGDTEALSKILMGLIENPTALKKYRKKAFDYGQKMAWSVIGKKYRKLITQTIAKTKIIPEEKPEENIINQQALPILSPDHIQRMTDSTGILQHSSFGVPNRHEGYALDDNSRALLMATMLFRQTENPISKKWIPIYLSFIHYMQRPEGDFHNLLSYDRCFLDETGTEDAFGRTIWALGYFIRYTKIESYFQHAREIFDKAASKIEQQKSIRAVANCIIGVSYYLHRFPGNDFFDNLLRTLTKKLLDSYDIESGKKWEWFEEVLAYDNAILPLALFHSYRITKDKKALDVAIKTMKFLEKTVFLDQVPSLVGNEQWYKKGKVRSQYAQQPIDAMALVLMYREAYSVLKKSKYIQKMYESFNWFLGENDLRIPLYDFETKGCKDGLESYGASKNQGAESTLAYLISHLTVLTINEAIVLQESI
ncbi:glycosyl transferase, partial [bacterium]|nr:glycosyl transferase [bacterium]